MKIRKVFILVSTLIVLLFIFNPTYKDFKEYIGENKKSVIIKKSKNYLIFSIYEIYYKGGSDGYKIIDTTVNGHRGYYSKVTYLGFIKNFIELG